jgi:hypothetical protein
MIDANSQFFAILTNVGMAKQANADALGIPWKFTDMGVGDANNTDPIPSASQTRLINEWRRRPLNQVRVDPANPAVIIAEQIIPADEGGRWIREIGVYDADGDLVAVANCAPTYKSLLSQGSGRTQVVRMNFIVSSTGNITLKIDPAVVLATREYVDLRIKNVTQGFAPINSPAFQGLPTAPAAPRFDNSKLLATTEWVRRQGKQYSGSTAINNSGSILATSVGQATVLFGDIASTINLPVSSDLPNGSVVTLICYNTASSAVTRAGTDLIYGADPGQSVSVQNMKMIYGDILELTLLNNAPGAGAWYVSGGNMIASVVVPQFDSGQRPASTQFVKRKGVEWGSFSSVSGSTTLNNGSVGSIVNVGAAAAVTITLPPTAPIASGGMIKVVSGGAGAVTISGSNGEICTNLSGSAISLVLGQGDSAILARLSGEWRLIGGSVALRHAAMFAGSTSTSGHQKLPNGQQECRGTFIASATPGAPVAVSFPLGFGRVDEVVITPVNASTTTSSAWHDSASSSGFNGRCNIPSAVCHYIAKGAAA